MDTIFVSSTFKDMYFERDALQEIVLPKLDNEANAFGRSVSFCDLRWGIDTADLEGENTNRKVLDICLDEIDRSSPPMVVLVGERYGWIPPKGLLQNIAEERRISLQDLSMSVTALEIEYGSFIRGSRTLFYFRETGDTLPSAYASEDALHRRKLEELKKRIARFSGGKIKTYKMRFSDGIAVREDVEAFAAMVYEDLSAVLRTRWEAMQTAASGPFRESRFFIAEKSAAFSARSAAVRSIRNRLDSGAGLILIKGAAGSGKSTLFSRLATDLAAEGWQVLPFISGISAENATAAGIAAQLIRYAFGTDAQGLQSGPGGSQDSKPAAEALTGQVNRACRKLLEQDKKYVIMIDAVDQLAPDDIRDSFAFIPSQCRDRLRVILTCLPDIKTAAIDSRAETVVLPPLGSADKTLVTDAILTSHHKQLSEKVLQKLHSRRGSDNPLFLSMLLQLLLMMNREDFEAINRSGGGMDSIIRYQSDLIDRAPDSAGDLAVFLISEAGRRFNPALIAKVCDYLAASRYGLRIRDLEKLCGKDWNYLDFSRMMTYLRDSFFVREDGRIDFVHKTFRLGLRDQYADMSQLHRDIFAVLKNLDETDPVRMRELLYHGAKADEKSYLNYYIACCATMPDKEFSRLACREFHDLCHADRSWVVEWLKNAGSYNYCYNILYFLAYMAKDLFGNSSGENAALLAVYREAAVCAEHLTDGNNRNITLRFRLYRILAESVEFFCRAGDRSDNPDFSDTGFARKYFELGKDIFKRGWIDKSALFDVYYHTVLFLKASHKDTDEDLALAVAEEGIARGITDGINPAALGPYYGCLGELYMRKGNVEKCLEVYRKDLSLRSAGLTENAHPAALFNVSGAYFNVGSALHNLLRLKEALPYFQKAVELQEKALSLPGGASLADSESFVYFHIEALSSAADTLIFLAGTGEGRLPKLREALSKRILVLEWERTYSLLAGRTDKLFARYGSVRELLSRIQKADRQAGEACLDELVLRFKEFAASDRNRFSLSPTSDSGTILRLNILGMISVIKSGQPDHPYISVLNDTYHDTLIRQADEKAAEVRAASGDKPDFEEFYWLFNKSTFLTELQDPKCDRQALEAARSAHEVIARLCEIDKAPELWLWLLRSRQKLSMCCYRVGAYEEAIKEAREALQIDIPEELISKRDREQLFTEYLYAVNKLCIEEADEADKLTARSREALALADGYDSYSSDARLILHSLTADFIRFSKPPLPDIRKLLQKDRSRLLPAQETAAALLEKRKQILASLNAQRLEQGNTISVSASNQNTVIRQLEFLLDDTDILLALKSSTDDSHILTLAESALLIARQLAELGAPSKTHPAEKYQRLAREARENLNRAKDALPLKEYMTGVHTHHFLNGNIYEGPWINGYMEGRGKMTYADGRVYEGSFVKGLREGFGTMTWDRGKSWYKGLWTKDVRGPYGETELFGFHYIGEWSGDKISGYGKKVTLTETVYGFWKGGTFLKKVSALTVAMNTRKYKASMDGHT